MEEQQAVMRRRLKGVEEGAEVATFYRGGGATP
jgi:hypothetical protein